MGNEGTYKKNTTKAEAIDTFLCDSVAALDVPAQRCKDKQFDLILQEIDASGKVRSIRVLQLVSSAACIILIIGFLFHLQQNKTYQTSAHEVRNIYLPDGSVAIMNERSTLVVNRMNWKRKRRVSLEGEAFFSVKKGSTFKVETEQATVSVLGTSFNVFSHNNQFRMECVTGKVKVINKHSGATKIATPGDRISLRSDSLVKEKIKPLRAPDWTLIDLEFKKELLSEVLTTIEKTFDIKIKYSNCPKKKFSGKIRAGNPADVLRILAVSMEFEYEQIENVYYLNFN